MPKNNGPKRTALVLCRRTGSFVAEPARLQKLRELLQNPGLDGCILGLNAAEEESLRSLGIPFRTEADFEHAAILADVNAAAGEMASQWYQPPVVAAALEYQGISLGSLVQHPMTYFLVGVMRDLGLLEAFCRTKTFSQVYLLNENSAALLPEGIAQDALRLLKAWYETDTTPSNVPARSFSFVRERVLPALWAALSGWIKTRFPPQARKILISSDLKHAAPVMAHLAKNPRNRFLYLRDCYGVRQIRLFLRQGIPFFAICEKPGHMAEDARFWDSLRSAVAQSGVFEFRGLSFFDAVEPRFKQMFLKELLLARFRLDAFANYLDHEEPAGILTDEDVTPFNKTLVSMANLKGIPSIVIQHGAPFEMVKMALAPVTCTKIAAWGEHSKRLLMDWGVPEEKIAVTGAPRYDAFTKDAARDLKNEVERELGVEANSKLVVFAADPFHEPGRADFVGNNLTLREQRQILQTLVRTLDAFPNCRLVVKLHPRDRYEHFFHRWIEEAEGSQKVTLTRLYPTPKLLQACDLLVTVCSTVAVEALIFEKPVITVNFGGGPDLQPHAEKGVALKAVDAASLREAIENVFEERPPALRLRERRREVLTDYVGFFDGGSSERVSELLETLIHETTPAVQEAGRS